MLSPCVTENFFGIVVFILAGYLMHPLYCLVPMTTSQGFQMTAPVYRKGRSQQELARLKADPHFGNWLSHFKHNIVDSAFGDLGVRGTPINFTRYYYGGHLFGVCLCFRNPSQGPVIF